jgi:hypothetical protein
MSMLRVSCDQKGRPFWIERKYCVARTVRPVWPAKPRHVPAVGALPLSQTTYCLVLAIRTWRPKAVIVYRWWVYVIEWSPFTLKTAEENAKHHRRREEGTKRAMTRAVDPVVKLLRQAELTRSGLMRHGQVTETLNAFAVKNGDSQIGVSRSSEGSLPRKSLAAQPPTS